MSTAYWGALALYLIPGAGLVLLIFPPNRMGIVSRLALGFVLGFASVGLVSVTLAFFGLLRVSLMIPLLAAVSIGIWTGVLRRFGLRSHVEALLEDVRNERWPLIAGLAVVLVVIGLRLTVEPLATLPGVASFRYWGDAIEIIDVGGFPDLSLQYGEMVPPATSKSLLDASTAAAILLLGRDPLAVLPALLFVASVGLAVGLWAAAWELGLRYVSSLFPLLVVANALLLNTSLTEDLDVYRAEAFGRMLAVGAITLGVRALRDRSWTDAIITGAVVGVGSATHLIALMIAVIVLGWYLFTQLLGRGPVFEIGRLALVILAVAALIGGSIHLLPRGELALEGASGEGYDALGYEFDPTLFLLTGRSRGPTLHELEYEAESGPISALESALNVDLPTIEGQPFVVPALLVIVLLAIALMMFVYLPKSVRHLGLVGWGTLVSIIVVTLLFAYMNDLYLLVVWGRRRLFDYSGLPILLIGLGLLEAGLLVLASGSRRRAGAVGLALAIGMAAIVSPSGLARSDERTTESGKLTIEMVDWIRVNTSCEALFLANQRTVGIFKAMTGRAALLEGMTPFLRPSVLDDLVPKLLATREFFLDPTEHLDFLEKEGVNYVVALNGLRIGHPFGARARTNLDDAEFLELVHAVPGARIYSVEHTGRFVTRHPATQEAPGYRCEREPASE